MMRSIIAAAVGFACAALSACGGSSPNGDPANQRVVHFTASINSSTRTTQGGNHWVESDRVGIFMMPAGGALQTDAAAGNVLYKIVNTSGVAAELTPVDKAIEYTQSGEFDFVAYYPYSASAGGGELTVDLANQSNPSDIDVLTAQQTSVQAGSAHSVNLEFGHALSKITINFKAGTLPQADVAAITNVVLTGTPGTATVRLGDGVGTGATADITMFKESAAEGFDATFSAIIAPHTGIGGRSIAATAGGQTIAWAIPATDAMAAGNNYSYPATVNSGVDLGALRLGSSVITPWQTISRDQLEVQEPGKGGAPEPVQPVNPLDPAATDGWITWKDGRYALTTNPADAGLYFKFGSVVGIFSGAGTLQTLPAVSTDKFSEDDVAWTPLGSHATWAAVPSYTSADFDLDNNTVVPPLYHTALAVAQGKGDPCRLVGLDLAAITAGGTAIDNGVWRLPTVAENKAFIDAALWGQVSGVRGVWIGDMFLPASGRRLTDGDVGAQGSWGYFWSSEPASGTVGSSMVFAESTVSSTEAMAFAMGLGVRCVRQ